MNEKYRWSFFDSQCIGYMTQLLLSDAFKFQYIGQSVCVLEIHVGYNSKATAMTSLFLTLRYDAMLLV